MAQPFSWEAWSAQSGGSVLTGSPDFEDVDANGNRTLGDWSRQPGVTDEIRAATVADRDGTVFAPNAFGRFVPLDAADQWWTPLVAKWGALALLVAVVLVLLSMVAK